MAEDKNNNKKTDNKNDKDEGVVVSKKVAEKLYKKNNLESLKFNKETIERLVDRLDKQNERKWEKFFIPALVIFSIMAILGYIIIYSITQDMRRLADAMDPQMSSHMSVMAQSVNSLANNINTMTIEVSSMNTILVFIQKDLAKITKNTSYHLKSIDKSVANISLNIKTLSPMLKNMQAMNSILLQLEKSMNNINNNVGNMTYNFDRTMSFMPF